MTMTEKFAVWLALHPRIRRPLMLVAGLQFLSLWALTAAPQAAAETGAAGLGWTGLHDTYGVPLKDYFLSVVSTSEAATNNGQGVELTDPSTWVKWIGSAMTTATTHGAIATVLTSEAAAMVFIAGVALWFLRFTLSSAWLVTIAQIGQPVFAAVHKLVDEMWLGPIAMVLCLAVGGVHWARGRHGSAWSVWGTGVVMAVLLLTLFRNPVEDLYSDHGLMAMGRSTGFDLALMARNGSYVPGQGLDAQLDHLTSNIVTAAVRWPLQALNFGTVVDTHGSCAAAWSTAIRNANGQGDGPAHAMGPAGDQQGGVCGYTEALAHAQFLGANDMILGAVYVLMITLFSLFLTYVGVTVMLVGLKALFFGIIVGPAFLFGIAGLVRARAFAKHCGWQIGIHAVEMTAFTAYLGIVTGWIMWLLTTNSVGSPDAMVTPRMIMLGLGSVVVALLFHFMDKSFHADGLGTIGHYVSGAYHGATGAARGHYDDARETMDQGRKAHRRYRDWRNRGIDDDYDSEEDEVRTSAEAEKSAPGFDVVKPRPTDGGAAEGTARSATAADAGTAATGAEVAEVGTVAAEGAAAVVAPEVVLPAAAAVEAAHLAHRHHDKRTGHEQAPRDGGHHHSDRARPDPGHQWPDGEVAPPTDADYDFLNETTGHEAAYPTVAPRSQSVDTNGRRPGKVWDQEAPSSGGDGSGGYDVAAPGQEAPGIEHFAGGGADDDPALEFPATPARQDIDPTNAKGPRQ